ncbi:MAG: thiol reductant ABC exporter subunit CydC [Pontibacterium sp.]
MTNFGKLKTFIALLKPHWPWVLCGLLLAVISTLANIALLAFSGWFLAAMALAGVAGVSMNYFTPAAIIRFLALVRAAGRYAERLVTHNATFKLLSDLRLNVFAMLTPLLPAKQKSLRSGELLNRVQSDVETLDHLYLGVLLPTTSALICTPILLWVVATFEPSLAIVMFIGLSLVGVGLPWLTHKLTQQQGRKERDLNQALRTQLIETLDGHKELKVFGGLSHQAEQFEQLNEAYISSQLKQQNTLAGSVMLSALVMNLSVLVTLVIVIPQVNAGVQVGSYLPMLCLLMLASFEVVQGLPLAFSKLAQCLRSAENIQSLGELPNISKDALLASADTSDKPATASQPSTANAEQALSFEQVNFGYDQDDKAIQPNVESTPLVLNQVSLNLRQGEAIAIMGPSGAGKSTLCHLINKIWQPNAGQVSVFGQPLTAWDTEALRNQVSTLSQQSYIFMGTLKDNLRMAKPDATEEQMQSALKLAGLWQFVGALPQGLDTWVGETGQGLSGGEARRLSLAQVLLRDTPLLLLDEPTEGLDNVNKQQINQRLHDYLARAKAQGQAKSLLLVTHDKAESQLAGATYWLEAGKLTQTEATKTTV